MSLWAETYCDWRIRFVQLRLLEPQVLHLNRKGQDRCLLNHPAILARQEVELLFWSEGFPFSLRRLRPILSSVEKFGLCIPSHVGWEVERLRSCRRICRTGAKDVHLCSNQTLQEDQHPYGLICQHTLPRPLSQNSLVKAIATQGAGASCLFSSSWPTPTHGRLGRTFPSSSS
jgi:hypothetical protein